MHTEFVFPVTLKMSEEDEHITVSSEAEPECSAGVFPHVKWPEPAAGLFWTQSSWRGVCCNLHIPEMLNLGRCQTVSRIGGAFITLSRFMHPTCLRKWSLWEQFETPNSHLEEARHTRASHNALITIPILSLCNPDRLDANHGTQTEKNSPNNEYHSQEPLSCIV